MNDNAVQLLDRSEAIAGKPCSHSKSNPRKVVPDLIIVIDRQCPCRSFFMGANQRAEYFSKGRRHRTRVLR